MLVIRLAETISYHPSEVSLLPAYSNKTALTRG